MCRFNNVSQTSPRLEHLIEVSQQRNKDVSILRMVEDVAVDDLCTVTEGGVLG